MGGLPGPILVRHPSTDRTPGRFEREKKKIDEEVCVGLAGKYIHISRPPFKR
jgi:hypothetical protein